MCFSSVVKNVIYSNFRNTVALICQFLFCESYATEDASVPPVFRHSGIIMTPSLTQDLGINLDTTCNHAGTYLSVTSVGIVHLLLLSSVTPVLLASLTRENIYFLKHSCYIKIVSYHFLMHMKLPFKEFCVIEYYMKCLF